MDSVLIYKTLPFDFSGLLFLSLRCSPIELEGCIAPSSTATGKIKPKRYSEALVIGINLMNMVKPILFSIIFGLIAGLVSSITIRFFFEIIPKETVVVTLDKECPPTQITICPDQAQSELSSDPVPRPPVSSQTAQPQIKIPALKGIKKGILTMDGDNIHVNRADLENLLSTNIEAVTATAKITPYKLAGVIRGFQLKSLKKSSIWAHMGLKKGDIFLSINGRSMNDAGQAIALLRSMRKLNKLSVDIDRRGQTIQKTIYVH